MRTLLLLLLTAISLCTFSSFAQQEAASATIQPTESSDAANLAKITQVYDHDYIMGEPVLKTALLTLLRDRISYMVEPASVNNKYPLISSVGLMTDLNPGLQAHDPATFSPETFNPLIYNWTFFHNKTLVYRIDGTDYIIIIQPQNI